MDYHLFSDTIDTIYDMLYILQGFFHFCVLLLPSASPSSFSHPLNTTFTIQTVEERIIGYFRAVSYYFTEYIHSKLSSGSSCSLFLFFFFFFFLKSSISNLHEKVFPLYHQFVLFIL